MEIYKIKDFEKVDEADADSTLTELRITDIRQAVKNENRVNVFVNDAYSFSLDISQVVDMHIKKGMVLCEAQLEEYKKASEFGKLNQRTLEWVLARPRSERETRDYLNKKIFEKKLDKNYIDLILNKLKTKNYVNDESFARWYVENRFIKKGVSQKRLAMELTKKGVAREIIDSVLDARNDEEEIKKIISKKRAKYDDEKLIQYLCRQGFSYQLVKDLVLSCGMD